MTSSSEGGACSRTKNSSIKNLQEGSANSANKNSTSKSARARFFGTLPQVGERVVLTWERIAREAPTVNPGVDDLRIDSDLEGHDPFLRESIRPI